MAAVWLQVGRRQTVIRLDQPQRTALSETTRDLANLVAAALVLGQFVGEQAFSWPLITMGAVAWLTLVVFGLALERRLR